jgi:hypothetical protein
MDKFLASFGWPIINTPKGQGKDQVSSIEHVALFHVHSPVSQGKSNRISRHFSTLLLAVSLIFRNLVGGKNDLATVAGPGKPPVPDLLTFWKVCHGDALRLPLRKEIAS